MAFPEDIMPKRLRPETEKEVDDNPSIYNARDYNIHHREIRAIQQALVGSAAGQGLSSQDVTGGLGSENGGSNIAELLGRYVEILDLIHNRGYVGQYAGTFQSGGQVPVPPAIVSTQTNGSIGASDSLISVVSTSGFPNSGTITKFNRLDPAEMCVNNVPPGGGSRCTGSYVKTVRYVGLESGFAGMTNQEVVSYTGKTATSFTGCTRGVSGTTSQAVTADTPALVLCGRASVSFSHNFWGGTDIPANFQFYLAQDALLKVNAEVLGPSSPARLGDSVQEHMEISWLLTVSGYFSDIDVSQLFNAQG